MKIMSFNVEGYASDRGPKFHWEHRSEANTHIILTYRPDVICIQEAHNQNIKFYSNNLPEYKISAGCIVSNIENESTGIYNPILWKKKQFYNLLSGSFYLSITPYKHSKSWGAKSIRAANWVKLLDRKSKTKFLCVNAHLDNHSEQSRIESSKLIVSTIDLLTSKENLPVILAGDFNSRPWIPPDENNNTYPFPVIKRCLPSGRRVYNVYIENGFNDTYFYTSKDNVLDMNTYHDYYGEKFPPVGLRIDWILKRDYQSIFTGLNYSVVKDNLHATYPSDHYPILAEFKKIQL